MTQFDRVNNLPLRNKRFLIVGSLLFYFRESKAKFSGIQLLLLQTQRVFHKDYSSFLPLLLVARFWITFVFIHPCMLSPSLNLPTGQIFNARSCLLSSLTIFSLPYNTPSPFPYNHTSHNILYRNNYIRRNNHIPRSIHTSFHNHNTLKY